jgi:phospholipid N-methyltransferase
MVAPVKFFWEFIKHPAAVGAVAPSSNCLAHEMVRCLDLAGARAVVEYGPGTGTFTDCLLPKLSEGTSFFAIEQSSAMAQIFRRRFPGVNLYVDTVANVAELCERENVREVDCILSGLPWASFSDEQQCDILEAMMTVLKPGGQFATFAYLQGLLLPAGQRFKKKLREYFAEVSKSKTVWLNFPPAFVYQCRR